MPSSTSPIKPSKPKPSKSSKSSQDIEKKRKRPRETETSLVPKTKKRRASTTQTETHLDNTLETPTTPFQTRTTTLYLPLAPISQLHPLPGLCAEHLSPLLLTYYPPLSGVILSYTNPRLSLTPFSHSSTPLLKCIDEFGVAWAWVTVDFLLFAPERGVKLEGRVNLQNEGHIGVVCYGLFNASVERARMPEGWKWVEGEEGEGWWVDGEGERVEGFVEFWVRGIEASADKEKGFLSIEGTMREGEEEVEVEVSGGKSGNGSERRVSGVKGLGATSLCVRDGSRDEEEVGGRKHRLKY